MAYAVAVEGADHSPQVLTESVQIMAQAVISPDGRYMAGTMGRAPSPQISVQSLSRPAGRWQVSTNPGFSPVWSREGRELV